MCIYISLYDYTLTAYPVITGDPSLYHTVCGLFHPLVSHPPTVTTAGKHCSKQPLHQICHRLHVSAFVCICDMSCRFASTQTPG